jgi:hypothetical protein
MVMAVARTPTAPHDTPSQVLAVFVLFYRGD